MLFTHVVPMKLKCPPVWSAGPLPEPSSYTSRVITDPPVIPLPSIDHVSEAAFHLAMLLTVTPPASLNRPPA